MTHTFTVPPEVFQALQGTRRHLFVKDSPIYATDDTFIVQCDREQQEFIITYIEHGPGSKHVNGRFCLIGLYAPYLANGEIKEAALPQRDGVSEVRTDVVSLPDANQ